MSIKDELMLVVRAFNALLHAPSDAEALADAQKQIADLKAADQLSDAEQAEVDSALASAAAATPGDTGATGESGATGETSATGESGDTGVGELSPE